MVSSTADDVRSLVGPAGVKPKLLARLFPAAIPSVKRRATDDGQQEQRHASEGRTGTRASSVPSSQPISTSRSRPASSTIAAKVSSLLSFHSGSSLPASMTPTSVLCSPAASSSSSSSRTDYHHLSGGLLGPEATCISEPTAHIYTSAGESALHLEGEEMQGCVEGWMDTGVCDMDRPHQATKAEPTEHMPLQILSYAPQRTPQGMFGQVQGLDASQQLEQGANGRISQTVPVQQDASPGIEAVADAISANTSNVDGGGEATSVCDGDKAAAAHDAHDVPGSKLIMTVDQRAVMRRGQRRAGVPAVRMGTEELSWRLMRVRTGRPPALEDLPNNQLPMCGADALEALATSGWGAWAARDADTMLMDAAMMMGGRGGAKGRGAGVDQTAGRTMGQMACQMALETWTRQKRHMAACIIQAYYRGHHARVYAHALANQLTDTSTEWLVKDDEEERERQQGSNSYLEVLGQGTHTGDLQPSSAAAAAAAAALAREESERQRVNVRRRLVQAARDVLLAAQAQAHYARARERLLYLSHQPRSLRRNNSSEGAVSPPVHPNQESDGVADNNNHNNEIVILPGQAPGITPPSLPLDMVRAALDLGLVLPTVLIEGGMNVPQIRMVLTTSGLLTDYGGEAELRHLWSVHQRSSSQQAHTADDHMQPHTHTSTTQIDGPGSASAALYSISHHDGGDEEYYHHSDSTAMIWTAEGHASSPCVSWNMDSNTNGATIQHATDTTTTTTTTTTTSPNGVAQEVVQVPTALRYAPPPATDHYGLPSSGGIPGTSQSTTHLANTIIGNTPDTAAATGMTVHTPPKGSYSLSHPNPVPKLPLLMMLDRVMASPPPKPTTTTSMADNSSSGPAQARSTINTTTRLRASDPTGSPPHNQLGRADSPGNELMRNSPARASKAAGRPDPIQHQLSGPCMAQGGANRQQERGQASGRLGRGRGGQEYEQNVAGEEEEEEGVGEEVGEEVAQAEVATAAHREAAAVMQLLEASEDANVIHPFISPRGTFFRPVSGSHVVTTTTAAALAPPLPTAPLAGAPPRAPLLNGKRDTSTSTSGPATILGATTTPHKPLSRQNSAPAGSMRASQANNTHQPDASPSQDPDVINTAPLHPTPVRPASTSVPAPAFTEQVLSDGTTKHRADDTLSSDRLSSSTIHLQRHHTSALSRRSSHDLQTCPAPRPAPGVRPINTSVHASAHASTHASTHASETEDRAAALAAGAVLRPSSAQVRAGEGPLQRPKSAQLAQALASGARVVGMGNSAAVQALLMVAARVAEKECEMSASMMLTQHQRQHHPQSQSLLTRTSPMQPRVSMPLEGLGDNVPGTGVGLLSRSTSVDSRRGGYDQVTGSAWIDKQHVRDIGGAGGPAGINSTGMQQSLGTIANGMGVNSCMGGFRPPSGSLGRWSSTGLVAAAAAAAAAGAAPAGTPAMQQSHVGLMAKVGHVPVGGSHSHAGRALLSGGRASGSGTVYAGGMGTGGTPLVPTVSVQRQSDGPLGGIIPCLVRATSSSGRRLRGVNTGVV